MVVSSIKMPVIFPVTCHTDFVGQGSIFVAIQGHARSGLDYIKQAIDKGATSIVVQDNSILSDDIIDSIEKNSILLNRVHDTRQALADLSCQYAAFPAKKLKVIGITGTKGKTTTSFLVEHILSCAGFKTALIGTVHNKIIDTIIPSVLTTPPADYLQQFLKVCIAHEVDYVILEVAAQAISLQRIRGIEFDALIFTNFSHEHLEFYSTLDDYFNAKKLLFSTASHNALMIINADDERGKELISLFPQAVSYGFCSLENLFFRANDVGQSLKTVSLQLINDTFENDLYIECSALFGRYNGYNVLSAIALVVQLGISSLIIQKALQSFVGVPGRLETYMLSNGATAIVDYAHNPISFYSVLTALRILTADLIVVFGAGGERDKTKRPIMGSIVASLADRIVLTSDNPRSENADDIINDIQAGISKELEYKVSVIIDRKAAIELAYMLAGKGSIIALLGKGSDEFQIIGKRKHYFSERIIIRQLSNLF